MHLHLACQVRIFGPPAKYNLPAGDAAACHPCTRQVRSQLVHDGFNVHKKRPTEESSLDNDNEQQQRQQYLPYRQRRIDFEQRHQQRKLQERMIGEGSAAEPGPSGAMTADPVVIPHLPSLLPTNQSPILPPSQNTSPHSAISQSDHAGRILISQATGLIDGGTTHHLMREDVLKRLQQQGTAPVMTPMSPGEMHIAFGRESNPETVVGFITTSFGTIYIVKNMSAEMLIAEIAFTQLGGIIIKNDTQLLILINNNIVLTGTRDADNAEGTNETLWMANIEDLFKTATPIGQCGEAKDPEEAIANILSAASTAMQSAMTWTPSAFQTTAFSRQLAASVPPQPDTATPDYTAPFSVHSLSYAAEAAIHANSAKPRWPQAEVRRARNYIWAVGGKASALARTLKAQALHGQPNIDPELISYIGNLHDNPAYVMGHSLKVHPGGSGVVSCQPGEELCIDLLGLWQKDQGVHTKYAMMMIDRRSKFRKVMAVDTKHTAADAVNRWRDIMAEKGWLLKRVRFDAAAEVSKAFREAINKHIIETMKLEAPAPNLLEPQRALQGVEVTKEPAEHYELTTEGNWRSIQRDFATALTSQNNINPQHFWYWCLKHVAEGGNAFIHEGHPTKTPFEIIYGRQPDAAKVLMAPWGSLVVCAHVEGNESGLVATITPRFDLAVFMGGPLELDNIYLVMLAGTNTIIERTDIRPLMVDELRLTAENWQARAVQFDESGRIIGIPSTNTPLPTLANVQERFDRNRFATAGPITPAQVLYNLEDWKGRIRRGGTFTKRTTREEAGRRHRSDSKLVRDHELQALLDVTSGAEAPHPVRPLPPLPSSDSNPPPTHPLPEQPFTIDHTEVSSPKPIAKWFLGEDTAEMVLFEGTVRYYLPVARGRKKPLFRIEYPDGDYEDVTLPELKLQQQLAKSVAKERAKRQQQQLPLHLAQVAPPLPPNAPEEEDHPVYWHEPPEDASASAATTIMMSANVARAFIQTYDDLPTKRDALKCRHLNNKQVVTSEDITDAYKQRNTVTFSDDDDFTTGSNKAYEELFHHPPNDYQQDLLRHLASVLQRAPSSEEIKQALLGPSHLQRIIVDSQTRLNSVAYAATTSYNELNPSYRMAQDSPDPGWKDVAQNWFKTSVANGELEYMSMEEAQRQGIKIVRHLRLFKTKPDGTRKFRHTPDEQPTPQEKEDLGNLHATGIPMVAVRTQIAHGAYNNMAFSTHDHINAYPSCNAWDDVSNVRKQRVGTVMDPWETGLNAPVVAVYKTVTNGLCDAPRVWSAIHTRAVFKIGFTRSAVYKDSWYMIRKPAGLLIMDVYVDDALKTRTRNAEGTAMHKMVTDGFNKAGMPMKDHELDDNPDGIGYVGLHIAKFVNDKGSGISLTQPNMHKKLAECLREIGVDPEKQRFNPHCKEWSEQASIESVNDNTPLLTHRYLRVLGSVNYLMATRQYHPVLSALSHRSMSPRSIDLRAAEHLAQHHLTTAHIPVNYYRDESASIKVPMPFTVDTDSGECNRIDGQGQCGNVARPGPRGSLSGAIWTTTKSIKQGHCGTPGEEAWSLWHCLGFLLTTRYQLEEWAGMHLDPYLADFADKQPPTSFGVRQDIGEALISGDTSIGGNATFTMVSKWIRDGLHRVASLVSPSTSSSPADIIGNAPTHIGIDSLIMAEIVVKKTETDRLKGLRPMLRFVRPIFEAMEHHLISVVPQSSEANVSDQLTHLPVGPLSVARAMVGIVGYSIQWAEYLAKMTQMYAKKSVNHNHNNSNNIIAAEEYTAAMPPDCNPANVSANVTTRAQGQYVPGFYDLEPSCVAEAEQGDKGTGVYATRDITAGTLIIQYGDGQVCTQAQMNARELLHPSDKWYEVIGGPHPLYIDGQDCMAANINHECGAQRQCPANVQLYRDPATGLVWVQAIKDIPGPIPGPLEDIRTFLGLDYRFEEEERFRRGNAQEWWRAYDCPYCHKSNRCVRATPIVFVAAGASANAAWLHSTRPTCLTAMARYGYGSLIQPLAADDNPGYNVFRPMSKSPPNKNGLGYQVSANAAVTSSDSQPLQPPLILRAYMTVTAQPLTMYEAAHRALRIPAVNTRALITLTTAHTISNSNAPFRRRMRSIIQEGTNETDDIIIWHINTPEELARHDLVRSSIKKAQTIRAAAAVLSTPTKWQSSQPRRSAEQQQRLSIHHFHAVSSGDQRYSLVSTSSQPPQPLDATSSVSSSPPSGFAWPEDAGSHTSHTLLQPLRAASAVAAVPPSDRLAWTEDAGSHTHHTHPPQPLRAAFAVAAAPPSDRLAWTEDAGSHTHHTHPQTILPPSTPSSLGHGNTSYLHHQVGPPPPPPPPFSLPPPPSTPVPPPAEPPGAP